MIVVKCQVFRTKRLRVAVVVVVVVVFITC